MANHLSSEHPAAMTTKIYHDQHYQHQRHHQHQQQQQQVADNAATWPRRQHRRHNYDDETTTTQRRHVDSYDDNDNVVVVADGPPKHTDVYGKGPATAVNPSEGHRRIVRGGRELLDDDDDDEVDETEYLDELSALRSETRPAGRMMPLYAAPRHHPTGLHSAAPPADAVAMTTTMTSSTPSSSFTAQPSRRLTLPSIVKYPTSVDSASPPPNTRHTGRHVSRQLGSRLIAADTL